MFRTIVAGCNGRERGNGAGVARAMSERFTRALPPLVALAIVAGAAPHLAGATGRATRCGRWRWSLCSCRSRSAVARSLRAGDVGVDAIALLAMAGGARAGRVAGRRGRRADAQRRQRAGGGGRASRRARADRAARARAADRASAPRRRLEEVGVDAVRRRRHRARARRRGRAGRRHRRVRATAAIDESALTGEPLPVTCAPRRARAQRRRERGRGVRPARHAPGRRQRLRGDRAARAGGRAPARAVRAAWPIATRPSCCRSPSLLAGGAWAFSGDAVRALAVLVVATPCPLILAAPIALVSGHLARRARRHRGQGGGRDRAARPRAHACCSTRPGRSRSGAPGGRADRRARRHSADELLRLAASVDQLSAHVVAEALVHDAEARGLALAEARDVHEQPGDGIEGAVDGPPRDRRIARRSLRARGDGAGAAPSRRGARRAARARRRRRRARRA